MRKHLPYLLLGLLAGLWMVPQEIHSQNCPNADFSAGNFTNWLGRTGTYNNPGIFNLPTAGIVIPAYHNIMTVPGVDPNTGGGLQVIAPGYTFSARLNSQGNTNGRASQLSYSLNVDPTNALFIYNYAVVLNDGGHSATQQPKFEIQVRDPLGNIIPCTLYEVAAGNGVPGFIANGDVRWKDWEKVGVDLTAYMGQTVTIEARVAGCVQEQGAHYGYGYIVGECQPLQITVEYCLGDTVAQLTAPDGFASYYWSTGETTQTISITNPLPGAQSVDCTITSVTGCQAVLNTIVEPVIVTAGFSYVDNCGEVQFTDTSTATGSGIITQWNWDFDDAGATSSAQNPAHQYGASGGYDVTLIATTSIGCSDTITISVPVSALPTASFMMPTNCGLTNTFADSGSVGGSSAITSYDWNFGDGGIGSGSPVTHTYATSGTWNVQLVVTNADGCKDTLVQSFTNRNYPTADFTFTDECLYDSITFTDASSVVGASIIDWDWTLAPGVFVNNTTSTTHLYSAPGTYNVQLIIETDESCADTVIKAVNVWEVPNASYTVNSPCLGFSSAFNNTSTIGSGSMTNFDWSFGDPGNPNSSLMNPVILYVNAGNYNTQLIVTSNHNCRDTADVVATVWPVPDIDFTAGPLEGCYPFTVNFDNLTTITPGTVQSYSWDFGNGTGSSAFEPSVIYPNVESQYSVTLTAVSDHGCDTSFTRTNYITVHRTPIASFTYTPTDLDVIRNIIQIVDLAQLADTYWYDFGDGTNSTLPNPNHQYASDTATYIITQVVTSQYGCVDTADAIVHIKPTFTIYIPNTFTPNGDGLNDFFSIAGIGLTDATMLIFDRWGENIATVSGIDPMLKGWDGTKSQEEVKQDVYVYKIEVTDIFGDKHEFMGQVNLIR